MRLIFKRESYFFLLIMMLVIVSGNQIVNLVGEQIVYCLFLFLLLVTHFFKAEKIYKQDLYFIAFFVLFCFMQVVYYDLIVMMASIGYLIKLLIALLVVCLTPKFYSLYITVMVYICSVSLVFYLPTVVGVDLRGSLSFLKLPITSHEIIHIGIHNFHRVIETRNSGMFWEPGAFAGYIVIAFLFALLFKIKLTKTHLGILILTLITTQSTTGYVAALVLLLYRMYGTANIINGKLRPFYIIFVSVFIVGFLTIAITNIDFLGDKITEQVELTQAEATGYEINRFGNIVFDIYYILEKPFIGWGANPETRYEINPELAWIISGQGVGLTGYIVKFGLITYFLLMYFIYRNVKKISKSTKDSCLMLITVNLLLLGEQFTNYPLFYVLIFNTRQYMAPKERDFGEAW